MKYLKWCWRVVRAVLELFVGLMVLDNFRSPEVMAAAVGLYATIRSAMLAQAVASVQQFEALSEMSLRVLERVGGDDEELREEVKEARKLTSAGRLEAILMVLVASVPVTILFWMALLRLIG